MLRSTAATVFRLAHAKRCDGKMSRQSAEARANDDSFLFAREHRSNNATINITQCFVQFSNQFYKNTCAQGQTSRVYEYIDVGMGGVFKGMHATLTWTKLSFTVIDWVQHEHFLSTKHAYCTITVTARCKSRHLGLAHHVPELAGVDFYLH
jgi:hypothetical protein